MKQGTQSWCTGTTLRDGMGRRWEGVSGRGTHVHPWLIHVIVWQKPLQCCKEISLQLKKKNTGVGNHSLLQGIFPAQESNPGLLHCWQILCCLSHQGSLFQNKIKSLKNKIFFPRVKKNAISENKASISQVFCFYLRPGPRRAYIIC